MALFTPKTLAAIADAIRTAGGITKAGKAFTKTSKKTYKN